MWQIRAVVCGVLPALVLLERSLAMTLFNPEVACSMGIRVGAVSAFFTV
jgi:ABC-type Mn2+/Zn2+ transport system permease subunit